jgi:hypothetical protein
LRLAATALVAVAVTLAGGTGTASAITFFQSPSGNIGCAIGPANGVRCDITVRDWKPPPKPAACRLDWGHALGIHRRGAGHFICAGDTTLGQGRRLPYGEAIRRGRFRCLSRRSGMRCVNRRNEHGFSLSRERARRF